MVTTFYQTGPNGLFIFYQVFNLILQSAKKIKSKNKTSKDKIKKLGLSIKDVGKPIEKNKNKIIELDVKDDKDQKDKQNKPKDNEKHS